MTPRWTRFVRGWVAASFATFVAALSHGGAGGAHPPLFAIALALAFSGIASIALSGRSPSPVRLSLAVVISQLLYHGLFSLFGTGTAAVSTVVSHHHTVFLVTGADASPTGTSPWMWLAHGAAALATITCLLYGERLCRSLSTGTAFVMHIALRRLPGTPAARNRTRLLRIYGQSGRPRSFTLLCSMLRHRGPPVAPGIA
ncbi:MAG: hypothetical protein JWP30_1588 [Homoserinimonas sp.]|jgi:hypothetical protein|nr:hypothetical protein [Homoserinimonas sp.]